MKFFLSFIATVLMMEIAGAQITGFEQDLLINIKNYKSIQLDNGFTLIVLDNGDTNSFFVRAFTDLPGYTSKDFQSEMAIDNELRKFTDFELPTGWRESVLSDKNIVLAKDTFGFYASFPTESLDTVFYLFSNLLQKPLIKNEKIARARTNILAASDSLLKMPEDRIDKITKSIIYGKDHPILKYANPAQLNEIDSEKYLEFYERFYKPNNSYLVLIGSIPMDSIKSLAVKTLGGWKKKDLPEASYKLIPIEEPKIVFFDTIPTGKTNIKILFPFALYPFTFDSEKAELLSALFQDILSEKLMDNLQLASNIDARFESDKITGNYQLNVRLEKDSLNVVIQAIISTISDLKAARYPEEKLKLAKYKIVEEFKKNGTSKKYLSSLIINTERNNLPKEYYANFIDDIYKVDQNAMRTFAAKYLNYNTALFQIPGRWYHSLNDFIKLCPDFRIELYNLDGTLKKVIPKGFNGFSVVDKYIEAIGGFENINKIKDVNIRFGEIYELENDERMLVDGIIIHKSDDKYFTESQMIRLKKDTIFLRQQIFDGINGLDSTMQGKKMLHNIELELLKYKSPFVPEMKYKDWNFKVRLVKADTLAGSHVWVVVLDNPAKQRFIDFYDVDKGIRYKRIITDQNYFQQRTINYAKYQRTDDKEILYPYLKTIVSSNTTIRMIIREVDYKSKVEKKLFEFLK
ncbi:MAG: insulinase family protein [Bacteroidales bacterium]|nr:insulinase family protein [Bacteroidales bacterium]